MARVSRKKKEPGIVLKKQIFSTALYVRLSREDNLKGDSYSIENQILLLKEVMYEKVFVSIKCFIISWMWK